MYYAQDTFHFSKCIGIDAGGPHSFQFLQQGILLGFGMLRPLFSLLAQLAFPCAPLTFEIGDFLGERVAIAMSLGFNTCSNTATPGGAIACNISPLVTVAVKSSQNSTR